MGPLEGRPTAESSRSLCRCLLVSVCLLGAFAAAITLRSRLRSRTEFTAPFVTS